MLRFIVLQWLKIVIEKNRDMSLNSFPMLINGLIQINFMVKDDMLLCLTIVSNLLANSSQMMFYGGLSRPDCENKDLLIDRRNNKHKKLVGCWTSFCINNFLNALWHAAVDVGVD